MSRECQVDLPQRRHGDYSVPKGSRNGDEIGAFDVLLCVEHDGGEDDDGHSQWEHQKAQLAGAALQSVAEDPQSLRVARKFENAKHAEDAQRNECTCKFKHTHTNTKRKASLKLIEFISINTS